MKIEITPINNPRKKDGSFGDVSCGVCGAYSGAYVELRTFFPGHLPPPGHRTVICGGCLDNWGDLINKTILKDCVEKGKLTKFGR